MSSFRREFQERMTKYAAHIRNLQDIKKSLKEAQAQYNRLNLGEISLNDKAEIVEFFQNRQLCLTQVAILKSIEAYLEGGGGSRGSYLVLDKQGELVSEELNEQWKYRSELVRLRKFILEYQYRERTQKINWIPVREIPQDKFWFEKVWKSYINKEIY